MKKYVEFTVWNELEERQATDEEINEHVRLKSIGDGKVVVETDGKYSVLTD